MSKFLRGKNILRHTTLNADRLEELSFSVLPFFTSLSWCWCFLFMLYCKHFLPLYDLYNLKENEILHSNPINHSRWRWNIAAELVLVSYANLIVTPQGIKYYEVQIGHYKHKTVNCRAPFMLYRNTVVNCSQDLAFDSALFPVKAFHITHHTSLAATWIGCISKLVTDSLTALCNNGHQSNPFCVYILV